MIWLTDGQVYDVERGAFRRADIAIDGARIAELVDRAKPGKADTVHDMGGAWLLPGLIDAHVHVRAADDADRRVGPGKARETQRCGGRSVRRKGGGTNLA